ncbi:MAG: hypothetical protein R2873_05610 [Caldilineaceae bacterium]|nr:hypothetical protein [Caldilineaceae bacterium]
MKRKLIPLLLVGTFLVWLVGSYLPQGVVPWRTIPGEGMDGFLRAAVIVSAVLFVLIQIVLVASVFKFPQRISRQEHSSSTDDALSTHNNGGEILIKRGWEVLWTVTPLVGSLALFIVSYWVLSG